MVMQKEVLCNSRPYQPIYRCFSVVSTGNQGVYLSYGNDFP